MTRHLIGVSPQGPVTLYNIRRDISGLPLILMDEQATQTISIDMGDWIQTGETITTATVAGNVTTTISTSGSVVTLEITDPPIDGLIDVLITSSTGDVYQQPILIRKTQRLVSGVGQVSDYGVDHD